MAITTGAVLVQRQEPGISAGSPMCMQGLPSHVQDAGSVVKQPGLKQVCIWNADAASGVLLAMP